MVIMLFRTYIITSVIWLFSASIGQSHLQDSREFVNIVEEISDDSAKANYDLNLNSIQSFWKRALDRHSRQSNGRNNDLWNRFKEITTPQPAETWTGRWLPPRTSTTASPIVTDVHHGIAMGISSSSCDDAKTNLTIDWDLSPVHHTCYNPTHRIRPDPDILPNMMCEHLGKDYFPQHICMDKPIIYNASVPTHGDHRPLWPKYGEYKYLPVQRWLHSIEHGAVVLLYHPCANPVEVYKLKQLVKGCLWRHIITPYRKLSIERPLALLTWGCLFEMSTVDRDAVRHFIQSRALKGPEKVSADGQYNLGLIHHSEILAGSSANDSKLCPFE